MSGRVAGKVAVVTGAGTGIGRATCISLAKEGAEVIVTSRTPAHVEETRSLVEDATGRAPQAFQLDLTDPAQVDDVVGAVDETFGHIDVLVNNSAVILHDDPGVTEITDEEWDSIFDVNVKGIFRICKAALPLMRRGSTIVNIGSINSLFAQPNTSAYSATKGALFLFTRALAVEYASRGIRANLVCPGIIDTPMNAVYLERAEDPDALRRDWCARCPMERIGQPEEVASCTLFLASDEASFVTGTTLVVDGGATADYR